jgi:hypothetical protein
MEGKAKFDQEAAFKAIVGAGKQPISEVGAVGQIMAVNRKNKERVQRSYFIDRDLDKALRRMALEKEKNLTESINEILRNGLNGYL